MIRPPPRATRTDTLCPYTTLFRSQAAEALAASIAAPLHRRAARLRPDQPHLLVGFLAVDLDPAGVGRQGPILGSVGDELVQQRSEDRRCGKEFVRTVSSRWSSYNSKKNNTSQLSQSVTKTKQ